MDAREKAVRQRKAQAVEGDGQLEGHLAPKAEIGSASAAMSSLSASGVGGCGASPGLDEDALRNLGLVAGRCEAGAPRVRRRRGRPVGDVGTHPAGDFAVGARAEVSFDGGALRLVTTGEWATRMQPERLKSEIEKQF